MHRVVPFLFVWPLVAAADASVPAVDARLQECLAPIQRAVAASYDPKREGQGCSSGPSQLGCYGCYELVSEHNDASDWVPALEVYLKPAGEAPGPWKSYGGEWGRVWYRSFRGVYASVSIHPCEAHPRSRLQREAEMALRTLEQCLAPASPGHDP